MDTFPPEILHVVCTFLDIENILRFRLVNKAFADIGAAYMLPEVSFYMFEGDFARLRAIAAHPIIAKHVHSLTYFAEVMDRELVSFDEYVRDHRRNAHDMGSLASFVGANRLRERLSLPQLQRSYREYEAIMKKQSHIVENHTDVQCLKEILPKFTSLRQATMSSGNEFYEGKPDVRKVKLSPFISFRDGDDLQPAGKRHLNGLIAGLISSNCQLESFRAGLLDWKFFKNFTSIPDKLADTLKYLKRIDIAIDADPLEKSNSISRCRRVMETGVVRKLLKPLEHLEVLHVTLYPVEWVDEEWPATMGDLIAPNHRWPNLRELGLGGFSTNRHDLIKFLELHKSTLRTLCLRDLTLGDTSWWQFLPEIRNKLDLQDSCICGDIVGSSEDESQMVPEEYWDLSTPDVCRDRTRESINKYCCGGDGYPDEVPLKSDTVHKYWRTYVANANDSGSDGSFEDEEEDDDDEDDFEYGHHEHYYDGYDFDDDIEISDLAQMFFGGENPFMDLDGFGEVDEFGDEWEDNNEVEDADDNGDDPMPGLVNAGVDGP